VRDPVPSVHSPARRRIWWTRRAVVVHVALLMWIPGCAVACWWQVNVGLSGESLGWVYSVMWPGFAVFGTIFWWHFVHDDPESLGRRGLRRLQREEATGDLAPRPVDRSAPRDFDEGELALARAEAEDPELAAYNAYLAALAEDGRPGTWRAR